MTKQWRAAILALANSYYVAGHDAELRATRFDFIGEFDLGAIQEARAETYREIYNDLCALVGGLDPRPGGGNAPAKPW